MRNKMPADHDLRTWVDAQTYLAVNAAADEDQRTVSDFIRVLLVRELQARASARAAQSDRSTLGASRADEGRQHG